jgi:predicted RNA-binding Zn-ribbon protein involved in translation (DUF1610 family)
MTKPLTYGWENAKFAARGNGVPICGTIGIHLKRKRCAMQINRCPKCGREPEVIRLERRFVKISYEVECYDCGLHAGRYETRDEAVEKWNELTKKRKTK